LVAARGPAAPVPDGGYGLLQNLDKQLAENIVGLLTGQPSALKLSAEPLPPPKGGSNDVAMVLKRVRPIERSVPMNYFLRLSHDKAPVVGMQVELEPSGSALPGTHGLMGWVTAVEEGSVKLKYAVKPGDTFKTPFGPATVERFRDDGMMEIRLHPQVGHVVRLNYNLGYISKIDAKDFFVNTGHPFGGQTLSCEAIVRAAGPPSAAKQAPVQSPAAAKADDQADQVDRVQNGDLAWVQYRVMDEKGNLQLSNFPEDAVEMAQKPGVLDDPSVRLRFLPLVAGRPGVVPGLDAAVLGLRKGERKTVTLPADKAYGPHDDKLVTAYKRMRRVPLTQTLDRIYFEKRFHIVPKEGATFDLPVYGRARVSAESDKEVTFKLAPEKMELENAYGTTRITMEPNTVTYTLTPRIGAAFSDGQNSGVIVKSDDEQFTVDYNPPLAGQAITLEVAVHDVRKAADLADHPIHWQEDFSKASATARQEDKSIALMLYADWCPWCKRMFKEILTDPVITAMSDRFVWVKINSDKHEEYKARFDQTGFPMVVVLDKEGKVLEKRQGFQPVYSLLEALQQSLAVPKG
jgi:FKBP-type peptidyl-prolyl cis-trans isomerase 2